MEDLIFHSVCWKTEDANVKKYNPGGCSSDEEDPGPEPDKPKDPQCKIHCFGKTEQGESVHLQIKFFPWCFVECAPAWGEREGKQFIDELPFYIKKELVLESCKIVHRKKFVGFTNGKEFKFVRLVFTTFRCMKFLEKLANTRGWALYEANVDPTLKLFHINDLQSCGWLRVPAKKYVRLAEKNTWCHHDLECDWSNVSSLPDKLTIPPLVIASFDIETYSVDGSFPDPDMKGNDVIQVATTLVKYGEEEPFLKHCINLGECNPIADDVLLECVPTEIGVLNAWRRLLQEHHVDVILGYNIWGFDLMYMYKRAVYNDPDCDFLNLGKFRSVTSVLKKQTLSSSAYGHNEFQVLETHGILQLDLLQVIRKEHKLESYSLNNVSEHFLGERKVDMPAKEMFRLWKLGDPESKRLIGLYCVQDTVLPAKLVYKLSILTNLIEMARATHVPVEYLIPRGQQIKCFSQILKYLRQEGMVCPTTQYGAKNENKFEGATVLSPKKGAYFDIVSCLDFASLYPSIMIAWNLCHSTLVLDPKYDNLEGVEYHTVETDGTTYRFALNVPAILATLLRDLALFRKKAKKEMAAAKARGDTFMYNMYNGKQLAFKVSMNSIYGFCGAANGFLPCVPIASSVTRIGRDMIEHTKTMVEREYPGSEVVYG